MGRPGFKPGGWRHALPGGFDSFFLPPITLHLSSMQIAGHDFPDDLRVLVDHQVWARAESDRVAVVGITALGIALAGEIYMCRVKPVGTVVEQGRGLAVVELAKTIVSVKSPVSGTILALNPEVEARPELIREDPYGRGWLARLSCERLDELMATLLAPSAAIDAINNYAASAQNPDRSSDT